MAEQKNILILGASFAGLSAAHYFLKHILPSLPDGGKGYHVYLINPSTHWFTRPAAPRTVLPGDLLPYSKSFLKIEDGFKSYSRDTFSLVLGTATAMDASDRTVTVSLREGGDKVFPYHALIIATGTRTSSPILGLTTNSDDLKAAIDTFRTALPNAKSIVIAGGGPAGVETAGEIGEYLNGAAGWFSSRPAHPKTKITLLAGADKLLPILRPAIAKRAERLLNRVGVDVVYNLQVTGVSPETSGYTFDTVGGEKSGNTTVHLNNGETLEADIFIPATGVMPNTGFMDKKLLNERGYIETNTTTLRVDAAGPRVYAVGDVGAYTRGGVMDIYNAIPVALTNIKRDLLNEANVPASATNGSTNEKTAPSNPRGQDRPYKPNLKETQLVPVGRSKGVGAMFGFKLPSFMVWMVKGRDYFTGMAPPVQLGHKWKKESKWKGFA